MNIIFEMSHWLAAEKESIDSKAHEWFDKAVQGVVSQEEATKNIQELIIKRRTFEEVLGYLNFLESTADSQAEDEAWSHVEEDGSDFLTWDEMEEEDKNYVPDLFDEDGGVL